jgi:hypothetical protein
VINEYASFFKAVEGEGNYGGSEGVQWVVFERAGVKRAFANVYKDSSYFLELHGYDGRAIWGGLTDR